MGLIQAIPDPIITSATNATTSNGGAFSYQIAANNSPTISSATGLPSGLSVNSVTGIIGGATTQTGTSSVVLSATSLTGTAAATLSLTVLPSPPVITSASSVTAVVGETFQYAIAASSSPASYSATGLPAGLSIDPASRIISGSATAAGTSNVAISATNTGGTGNATLTIFVQTPYASWQSQFFSAAE